MTKVAFITGASRGIGRETALAFARAGFDVAISARTVEEGESTAHRLCDAQGVPLAGSLNSTAAAIRAMGRKALVVPMDLLDSASVLAAGQAVLAALGRIDVLINNAIYQGRDLNSAFMSLQPRDHAADIPGLCAGAAVAYPDRVARHARTGRRGGDQRHLRCR